MSDSYTKLFSSITESTIWSEPAGTRLLWITMLAKCNRKGEVFGSVPGLARLANITLGECDAAIRTLLAPDAWSRTLDNEGRRIEAVPRGWRILNHAKFDRLRSEIEADEREKDRKREWDRTHRPSGYARAKSDESPTKSDVSPTRSDPPVDVDTAKSKSARKSDRRETRPDTQKNGTRIPDGWKPSAKVLAWAAQKFPSVPLEAVLDEFLDYWRGVPGAKGRNLDWDATFRNRVRAIAERKGDSRGTCSASSRESASERVARLCADQEAAERGRQPAGDFFEGEFRAG